MQCALNNPNFVPEPTPTQTVVPGGAPIGFWAGTAVRLDGTAQQLIAQLDPSQTGNATPITTLAYGQVAVSGTVACVSQEYGLACWDTVTKHGFWTNSAPASAGGDW